MSIAGFGFRVADQVQIVNVTATAAALCQMKGRFTTVAVRRPPSAGTRTTVPSVKKGRLRYPRHRATLDNTGEIVLLVIAPTAFDRSSNTGEPASGRLSSASFRPTSCF